MRRVLLPLVLAVALFSVKGFAQVENNGIHDSINKDDLGNVSDKFQENFFGALTQSAIENYEKAIKALEKCQVLKPQSAVVYFELGKNYLALKNYAQVETNLLKASTKKPSDRAILSLLFTVYYQTKNYPKAIKTAKQLTVFGITYYEDLANLYLLNKNYVLALKALDKIDAKKGQSDYRDALRQKVFRQAKGKNPPIAYLKNKIKTQPKNTQNYADLIYVYSASGQLDKAFQAAKKLQEIDPDAAEAHLALYKVYRQKGEEAKAVASMKTILKSEAIGNHTKEKVIEDFTTFVKKHPQYENDLVQVLGEETANGRQSNQQLGEYYIGKDNTKAISFFKKALGETPDKFQLIRETLLLEVKENQFSSVLKLAKRALGIFPSQPILYLLRGVSENGLHKYQSAQESLSTGTDYVIDNAKMKADFFNQLAKAYTGMNKTKKAVEFRQKAKTLNPKTSQ